METLCARVFILHIYFIVMCLQRYVSSNPCIQECNIGMNLCYDKVKEGRNRLWLNDNPLVGNNPLRCTYEKFICVTNCNKSRVKRKVSLDITQTIKPTTKIEEEGNYLTEEDHKDNILLFCDKLCKIIYNTKDSDCFFSCRKRHFAEGTPLISIRKVKSKNITRLRV